MDSQMNKNLGDYTYATYQPQVQSLPGVLPSYMIEAKLSLRKIIKEDWFRGLENELQRNNMNICVDHNNIIVTGISPDDDFSEQSLLEIVQGHDSGAQMISFKELHVQ